MNNDYAEFRDIIRRIVKEEIEKNLKQDNIEKKYGGIVVAISVPPFLEEEISVQEVQEVQEEEEEEEEEREIIVEPYEQRCAVDLGFTTIGTNNPTEMIPNKSGEVLNIGDSVTVYANPSGNFVNSYIGLKHSPIN